MTTPGVTVEPVLLSVGDAASALGVGESTLRRMIRAGDVPAVRVAGLTRIRTADLAAFAAGLPSHEGTPRCS